MMTCCDSKWNFTISWITPVKSISPFDIPDKRNYIICHNFARLLKQKLLKVCAFSHAREDRLTSDSRGEVCRHFHYDLIKSVAQQISNIICWDFSNTSTRLSFVMFWHWTPVICLRQQWTDFVFKLSLTASYCFRYWVKLAFSFKIINRSFDPSYSLSLRGVIYWSLIVD